MSEPDIATLARRLAEQNNVDWRALSGSGEGGKIVERDVLDYLARVMAGDEALDPTPEPLPDGMEAWPDQDAPAYFQPNGASQAGSADALLNPVEDVVDDLLADLPEVPDLTGATTDEAAGAQYGDHDDGQPYMADAGPAYDAADASIDAAVDHAIDAVADHTSDAAAVFADNDVAAADAIDDVEISDDIFLFDDEDEADFGVAAQEEQEPTPTWGSSYEAAAEPAEDEFADDAFGVAGDFGAGHVDADDALLVADDDLGDLAPADDLAAAASEPAEFGEAAAAYGADDDADSAFASPLESYNQDFTTPSEQFEADGHMSDWVDGDLSDLGTDPEAPTAGLAEETGELPDLWASESQDDQTAEPSDAYLGSDEEPAAGYGDSAAEDLAGAPAFEMAAEPSEEYGTYEAEAAEEPDEQAEEPVYAAADDALDEALDDLAGSVDDDVADLERASELDERDAVADLEALDGQPEPTPAAAFAELPLVRTGNVLRRHVDLSALAGAQLAVGLELHHDEPLTVAPFLVRAVARAAAELGVLQGEVALAELADEVRYRRVDDAAARPFASLVEELATDGAEEDELGLVAVDLSELDVDEVLLDVDVPAVTLGRVLYDTQRGAHRSTLSLSGDLPVTDGARLLARVADLLESPVRLLL